MTPYKPSAPAIHTVRTILRNFDVASNPDGKYAATQENLCKLIDVFTQVHKVEAVLRKLCSTVRWVHKHELEANLEVFREANRAIEIVRKAMPAGEQTDPVVSPPAQAAATVLWRHYTFTPRADMGRVMPTFRNLAIMIEVCTRIRVAQQAMDQALSLPWENRDDLRRCLDDLRRIVRLLEVSHNALPSWGETGQTLWQKRKADGPTSLNDLPITRKQREQLQEVSKALRLVRSPEQEQHVLRAARLTL